MALLEIKDLDVHYGGIHALKGVSLSIDAGEIVTLIGANGAGKTTTLRAISGLVKPSRGTVRFAGDTIAHGNEHEAKRSSWATAVEIVASVAHPGRLVRRIVELTRDKNAPHEIVKRGLVHAPEGRGIFSNMTVEENLEIGAFLRSDLGLIAEDRRYALSLFPRLHERLKQNAGTLSGGEQQMLAIARALMSRPKLLLLDEPSLGLAPQVVALIFKIVKTIAARGTTILLVEQNAHMALRVANRAYVLEVGEIVLEGPAKDLAKNDEIRKAYLGIHD